MANASDYLEQAIYNHIFRDATFSKPATIAIGLTLDVPLDDGTYTEVPNANGYARYTNASGDARWTEMLAAGEGENAVEFAFDPASGGDWGTVSGVIITDDPTWNGGNVLLHGALTSARTVQDGDTFKFNSGSLEITIM
jgi:hypothetical protein